MTSVSGEEMTDELRAQLFIRLSSAASVHFSSPINIKHTSEKRSI